MFTSPFMRLGSGKFHTSRKATDRFIQYILRHVQPMLLRVSRGPGQAVYVMYRFDDVSRIYFKFPRQHIANVPNSSQGCVSIPIQAVRLTWGAVLKWTFNNIY